MIKQSLKILINLFFLFFLSSCTDFFSTSWAKWAVRDPSKLIPNVTLGNVNDLIDMAENDPGLSFEVLQKIAEAAAKASGDEKAGLQAAAVGAAVNAVGLGQTIIGVAGDLANIDTGNTDDAKSLAISAINNMPNLEGTGDALYNMLPSPGSDEFDRFVENASAEDLAMAAVLLLAGDAKKNGGDSDDYENYVDGFRDDPSPQAELAIALAESIKTKPDAELPSSIQSILDGLNLGS